MSISVTNSLSLRIYYGRYSTLVKGSQRNDATTGTLSYADSTALRNAIRKLQDYDFEESSAAQVQEKLTAFCDSINNTLSSAAKYAKGSTSVKNAVSKIKELNSSYSSELKQLGITVNKDGTMSVYESAAKNYSRERYTKFFDKDSKYLNSLYDAATKITRRVDVRI
ncbi:hypothetical protein [Pseudobutyrivibrio xylanivorans]|uniref:Uncharacterized protein n=1 Tax=Pseudobutyrivibrio xylanivorans TaxID=185007 RepID=A0A5P6VPM5_PSEXY|nr:hypothetical protein [Pseudobutyrivibrio xylanivorans]QFJ54352.1 hypothetical protein FXF36_05525 [Pseudobutyrivibrio xylanivorans]